MLVSLSLVDEGRLTGWHIMLAIGDTADELKLLHHMGNDVDGIGWVINKSDFVRIHDTFPGGDDVAILDQSAAQ